MWKQIGSKKEATNGTKSAHGVHKSNVHGAGIPLDVVVDVSCSQSEERRSTAAQKQLWKEAQRKHEHKRQHMENSITLSTVLQIPLFFFLYLVCWLRNSVLSVSYDITNKKNSGI